MDMQTNTSAQNPVNPKRKKRKLRILFWSFAFLLFLLILLIAITPTLLSTKKGNQFVLDRINRYIEGKTGYSSLSVSWLKGVNITNLEFSDKTGSLFLFIKKLSANPHYFSLLTGSLSFGQTLLDEPRIEINLKTLQSKSTTKKNTPALSLPFKQIDLTINNGSLKVTDPQGRIANLSQVNSKLDLKSPGQQTSFDVDMNLSQTSEKSKVSASGQITPAKKTGWSLEGSTGNISIECNDLDIETLGPIFALAGIDVQAKGFASANLNAQLKDGYVDALAGSVNGRNIDITGSALKGDRLKTNTLNLNSKLARSDNTFNIENLDINTDWLKAKLTGSLPTTFDSLDNFLKSSSQLSANFDCQIGTILSQMPNTFAVKKGTTITAGLLKGNVETVTSAGKKSITGQATLTGLAGVVDGKNIAISQPVSVTALVSEDNGITRFDKLNVSSAFASLNCSGTLKELTYTAQSDLSKLQAELGQFIDFKGYNISGSYSEQGKVTFDKDQVGFTGSSQVRQFSLASKKANASEPSADIKFDMKYLPNDSTLAINYLDTDASLGKINIKNSTIAIKPENQSKLNLSAKSVDLEKVAPFAALFTSLPAEMKLSGLADSDVSITGNNETYAFKTDNTKISRLKISYPGKKDFEQDPVTLIADGSGNLKYDTFSINGQLTSPQIKIAGNFEKKEQADTISLKGSSNLEYNWAYASSMLSFFLPSALKIEGQRKDAINFASNYPSDKTEQLWPNLNATVTTGFDKAEYAGLTAGKVEMNIKAQNGLLNIEPFSTTLNGSKIDFAANADLKAKPVLLKTSQPIKVENVQINDLVANQILIYFNPIFKNSLDVTGILNFQCDKLAMPIAENNPNYIEAAGSFSIDNLKFQIMGSSLFGQILSNIGKTNVSQVCTVKPTNFQIQNGLVKYENMEIDIDKTPIVFSGAVGLDKKLYMNVTLPINYQKQVIKVTLPLTGTIDQPKLDTSKLPELLMKNAIENILPGLINEKLKGKSQLPDGQQKGGADEQLKGALEQILINQIGRITDQNSYKRQ
jgi:hypothetical protein